MSVLPYDPARWFAAAELGGVLQAGATMNWLVFHVASGQSFFSGLLLIVLAAITAAGENRRAASLSVLLLVLGAIAIAISSTPIPYWLYGVPAVAVVASCATGSAKRGRRIASGALVGVCLLCVAVELPFHVSPSLEPVGDRELTVVGDSVSAGLGDHGEVTWPVLFERQHDVRVQDLSHVGETAASALKRAQRHAIDSSIVLVEIGGNDVLGSTTASQFGRDLDALLSHLAVPGRQVVMFELPLPPFSHEYGRVQRDAAQRHGVALIPKRVFLSLLAGESATLDSIHLSEAGHQQMADVVWGIVERAFAFDQGLKRPIVDEVRAIQSGR